MDFLHVHRKHCDKVTHLFIVLFSGSLKMKSHQAQNTENSIALYISFLHDICNVHMNLCSICFVMLWFTHNVVRTFDIVNFWNLRAQLKSNKVFYVIINSFTLFNCRPAIKKKKITSLDKWDYYQKSLKQTQKAIILSSNTNVKKQMELRFL